MDHNLVPTMVEGEPRVRDLDLAERLEFAKPAKIRDLIKRHAASLAAMGPLPTVGRVINGGQATEFYLSKKQAIFLAAKSETPKATEITIEIIEKFDAYERGALHQPKPMRLAIGTPMVARTFRAYVSIAKLVGLDLNQAALSAARATKNETGIDPLVALGVTHLTAPQQASLLTASDIGVRLDGRSGRAINKLLAERGYQAETRDAKGTLVWEPTAKGQRYATWSDTAKKHSDGTPVRQLRWSATIVEELRADILKGAPPMASNGQADMLRGVPN